VTVLSWIVIFSLVGGALSVIGAAFVLLLSASWRARVLPHLVSFAIGALLGAAFLGLLPHAIEGIGDDHVHDITIAVLGGLMGFFALEKFVLWRHCHAEVCDAHAPQDADAGQHSAGTLILIGDGLHNFVDGVLIGAAFLTDIHLGVVTSIAVAAHEIPQEMGDFAVLLHSGYSRARALVFNILSSLTTVIGGVLAYYILADVQRALPYVLAVAAAGFIYVAVADLIPGLHRKVDARSSLQQIALISLGIALIFFTHEMMH